MINIQITTCQNSTVHIVVSTQNFHPVDQTSNPSPPLYLLILFTNLFEISHLFLSKNCLRLLCRSGWQSIADFTAIDVWMIACYLTVFICVFEYCIVIYLTKKAVWEETFNQRRKVDVLVRNAAQEVLIDT